MTQEEKFKEAKRLYQTANADQKYVLESLFPELKESEDERVRKEIIRMIKEDWPGRTDVIAWLEKQAQKPAIEMKTPEESLGIDSETYNKIVDECIYGEQKPAEDGDLPEFESHLCLMFQKFRTKGICTNGEIIDYVKEHSQKLKDILVNPTWSEEDDDKINSIKYLLHELDNHNFDNWLKSLKDRVQPQPKQEWSEEDEKMKRTIISDGIRGVELDTRQINWLKSLRPQNRWKPSDEQMLAIKTAINVLGKGTLNGKHLIELQEQLKKLK